MLQALGLAVVFIYLILASLFGSFIQPLSIMLSLPLSFLGVVLALIVTKGTLNAMSMIFGMLPLASALGEGAEQRAPMARAVIGGLITSTLLTLFVVPVVYTLLDDVTVWLRNRRRAPAMDRPESVPALADANVRTPA